VATSAIPLSRNWASSMAITWAIGSMRWAICADESTGIASTERPSWLDTAKSPA
jgi:hypothetical protein